jgi:HEAT repeat protein
MSRPIADDARPTPELVRLALAPGDDGEKRWDLVRTLQDRGTAEVLHAAIALCESADSSERELGVDILAQGRAFQKTFGHRAVRALLELLENEPNPRVLHAIGMALGHHQTPRSIKPLIRLRKHSDSQVRYAVAFGLSNHHHDSDAIRALIELSADEVACVRDWATFALGSAVESDTPQIRDALAHRLTDEDDETRMEALLGLASRGDDRALAPLLDDLRTYPTQPYMWEAAEALGDARLCAALLHARKCLPENASARFIEGLEAALERCGCLNTSRQDTASSESTA